MFIHFQKPAAWPPCRSDSGGGAAGQNPKKKNSKKIKLFNPQSFSKPSWTRIRPQKPQKNSPKRLDRDLKRTVCFIFSVLSFASSFSFLSVFFSFSNSVGFASGWVEVWIWVWFVCMGLWFVDSVLVWFCVLCVLLDWFLSLWWCCDIVAVWVWILALSCDWVVVYVMFWFWWWWRICYCDVWCFWCLCFKLMLRWFLRNFRVCELLVAAAVIDEIPPLFWKNPLLYNPN